MNIFVVHEAKGIQILVLYKVSHLSTHLLVDLLDNTQKNETSTPADGAHCTQKQTPNRVPAPFPTDKNAVVRDGTTGIILEQPSASTER